MKPSVKVHQYWNNLNNPSMPDEYLFRLEIEAIKKHLGPGKLLDVGCGEGKATKVYSQIKGINVTGIDFSEARLKIAKSNCPRVKFKLVDLTKKFKLDQYNYIVSQRFLINLKNWQQQKQAITKLIGLLKPKGRLILCEGSLQGTKSLNQFRRKLRLKPIPIRWHNVFINDNHLLKMGFKLLDGFGGYFLLTRGIRPFFDKTINWNCKFNRLAKNIHLSSKYSRLKIWQYEI